MNSFEKGYVFYQKNAVFNYSVMSGNEYVNSVYSEIEKLTKDLQSFSSHKTDISQLKGDIAEFWHAGTFNIKAAANSSSNRAFVDRSHTLGSTDVSTNFGKDYGLKYYENAIESSKQQAKSYFEKFNEYKANGGNINTIEEYLSNNGISEDVLLNDSIYSGQQRLIPTDQLKEAIAFLERKITKEEMTRPEQVARYKDTLSNLTDRISDDSGNQSIALTKEEAETLAKLSKEGKLDPEKLGLTVEEFVRFEHIIKASFKAGLSAATISLVLQVGPEIFNSIRYLIENGEIEKDSFEKIGMAAITGASEGFVKGTIAAAITASCKSGLLGELAKNINPSVIGAVTAIAFNTMKNTYSVVNNEMSSTELTNQLMNDMFITTFSLIGGGIGQTVINIPVLGFMIGNFIGSVTGSIVAKAVYNPVLSFSIKTGFTMFGLVDQNYKLPESIIKEIGIEVFEYENFDYEHFEHEKFEYNKFDLDNFSYDSFDIVFLRRGVIGVNAIGYV